MAAVGMVLTASAQKTEMQMATLQNGDQTIVLYGPHAFINAYNLAADSGSVITLSSGEFNTPSYIQKSLSIYGVGFEDDETTGTKRTYLDGQLRLKPADIVNEDGETVTAGKKVNGVHIEGLQAWGVFADDNNSEPIYNLEIVKCKLQSIGFYVTSHNCTIRQCVIGNEIGGSYSNSSVYANNLLVSNCHVTCVKWFSNNSTIKVDHSILRFSGLIGYIGSYTYTNSIFIGQTIPNYSPVSNCILMENSYYKGPLGENLWTGLKNAGVWAAEGEDGSYAEDKDFALKYPDRYIGTDGTEVGLHGGAYPWNKIPSIPRITECTIDTENAANGTIKVSIKAEAQTKE